MTDREKLAREMYVLHWGGDNWGTTAQSRRDVFLALADIAIAYADRRVAEAVEWMRDELCMCAPEREIDPEEKECLACSVVPRLLSAFSPAGQGGPDE